MRRALATSSPDRTVLDPRTLPGEGWEPLEMDNFSGVIGPVWWKGAPGAREVALLTGPALANNRADTVHGGALMTFADIALGIAAVDAIGEPRCATAQLNYQFMRGARVGSIVTCAPELVCRTRRLIFARGLFRVDGETVGAADGIFNVFED